MMIGILAKVDISIYLGTIIFEGLIFLQYHVF